MTESQCIICLDELKNVKKIIMCFSCTQLMCLNCYDKLKNITCVICKKNTTIIDSIYNLKNKINKKNNIFCYIAFSKIIYSFKDTYKYESNDAFLKAYDLDNKITIKYTTHPLFYSLNKDFIEGMINIGNEIETKENQISIFETKHSVYTYKYYFKVVKDKLDDIYSILKLFGANDYIAERSINLYMTYYRNLFDIAEVLDFMKPKDIVRLNKVLTMLIKLIHKKIETGDKILWLNNHKKVFFEHQQFKFVFYIKLCIKKDFVMRWLSYTIDCDTDIFRLRINDFYSVKNNEKIYLLTTFGGNHPKYYDHFNQYIKSGPFCGYDSHKDVRLSCYDINKIEPFFSFHINKTKPIDIIEDYYNILAMRGHLSLPKIEVVAKLTKDGFISRDNEEIKLKLIKNKN